MSHDTWSKFELGLLWALNWVLDGSHVLIGLTIIYTILRIYLAWREIRALKVKDLP